MTVDGLITLTSRHGSQETMERLIAAVTTRGATMLARIDHSANAASVGLELRPTEVVMFANPRAGAPLMQTVQTMGIDLPHRVLVWRDQAGTTRLSYNDPGWLAARHGIDEANEAVVGGMRDFLAAVAKEATD